MDDAERLSYDQLVSTWAASAADVIAFLRETPGDLWSTPTELAGWDVHAVAAHLAHLESIMAGFPQAEVEVPPAPHVTSRMSRLTEAGVIARRTDQPEQVVDELEHAVGVRARILAERPPASLADRGDGYARLMGWSWEKSLSNRIIDLWMHEQDIRQALDRPGNHDSAGARHTRDALATTLPYVLAKRAQAPAGTSVLLRVSGPGGVTLAALVGEDGRGLPVSADTVSNPTLTITMSLSEWVRRCGGRGADPQAVRVTGDVDLGQRVLEHLAVTP